MKMYLTFENPEYLWFLLSIPLLIVSHFAFLRYSKRKAIRFANFQALKRVSNQKIMTKNHMVLLARMVILFTLILAVSGTKVWYLAYTNQNDFVIAIDSSSSMTAKDLEPSRFEAAKDYTIKFIDELSTDSKVGLVSFSGASFIETLPTDDFSKLRKSINGLEIAKVGGTNIPDAIVTSTNLLLASDKGRTIILMTDGSNTVSYFIRDPILEGINYARQNNVMIYTIGIGSETGPIGYLPEYYNISSVYDSNTLMKIANETGGRYFDAKTTKDLDNTFDAILANASEAYIGFDLGIGLLIIALGMIFLEWGLISTRFRAIP